MLRGIYNHLGEKIGDLKFPEGTPTGVIDAEIAKYAAAPVVDIKPVRATQLRKALVVAGLDIGVVTDAFMTLDEQTKKFAEIDWEYATWLDRNLFWVDIVGASVGMSPTDLDNLWSLASTL